MSDDLQIISGSKAQQYQSLFPQIEALLNGEPDLVANLANTVAALKEQFGWLWVGFYLVKDNELVLGPFQGPVACTRISLGRGVCGTSWAAAQTMIGQIVSRFSRPTGLPPEYLLKPRCEKGLTGFQLCINLSASVDITVSCRVAEGLAR